MFRLAHKSFLISLSWTAFQALLPTAHAEDLITTVAGIVTSTNYANPVAAASSELGSPVGVATDAAGNLYIVDEANQRIRKVDTAGTITTVAGNGTAGYSGDGGPATSAELNFPTGVAVDATGNLYIAEQGNHRIRKVDTAGIITTIAGNGTAGYSGDSGPATSAEVNYPSGVAVDAAGNLYIADSENDRIRKVDTAGTITTVAGNGTRGYSGDGSPAISAQLARPTGVAVDSAGNLYIADSETNRIRKVDTAGTITTVAGNGAGGYSGDGGPATSAQLFTPSGVAVDATGNLYVADQVNVRVRKVDTTGTITTMAGDGTAGYRGDFGQATNAEFFYPVGVAIDAAGNLYIADNVNNRIRKVDTAGTITTVAGNGTRGYSGDGGPATSATGVNYPSGVAVDTTGTLYIADQNDDLIHKVDTAGTITTVAGNGTAGYSGDGGPAISAELYYPSSIAVDAFGNLYIADRLNHRIRKVDTTGTITTVAGNGTAGYSGDGGPAISAKLYYPTCVAVDATGNLYIADQGNQRLRKVDTAGTITTVAGTGIAGYSGDGGPATSAEINSPTGVAVDAFGKLYIADQYNHRIRKVDTAGTITSVAGNGIPGYGGDGGQAISAELYYPTGVAVDAAGNLYIADQYNQRIRMVDTTGIITTIAGTGTGGFVGDGGPATSAQLANPTGVAVDTTGDIYITESNFKTSLVTGNTYIVGSYFHSRLVSSSTPETPVGVSAQAGSAQVSLGWTAVSGATSYNIYQGTTAGGESATPIKTGISGTNVTITGLMNGTTYFFTVASINSAASVIAGGISAPSTEVSATPAASSNSTNSSTPSSGGGGGGGGGGGAIEMEALFGLAALIGARMRRVSH